MVDSRAKGARAELDLAKKLKEYTGHDFRRIPMSGALDAVHKLKGDLYIPDKTNIYCIEVKHYADDHLTSKILTGKTPQVLEWWQQTIREAAQISRKPLLVYKYDRSPWFVAFKDFPDGNYRYLYLSIDGHEFYTSTLEDWLKYEQPRFV